MSFLIQNIDNGNVELSENGVVIQVFPPNCEVSQDLTNSKFVVITFQGRAIYSISALKSYVVRFEGVDTPFSNGTPDAFAALLLSTVFSIQAGGGGGGGGGDSAENSYCTTSQANYVSCALTTNLYFLKGIYALKDTKIKITECVGMIENSKKAAIYLVKNIVLSSEPLHTAINDDVEEYEGDGTITVQEYQKIQIHYPSLIEFSMIVNKTIELEMNSVCGILLKPIQSNVRAWADINFEQL